MCFLVTRTPGEGAAGSGVGCGGGAGRVGGKGRDDGRGRRIGEMRWELVIN